MFKDKKFYIFLGIVILFFGLLVRMNYSVDTYLLLSSPRMGYIMEYLSSGRIFTCGFFFILGFLQVSHYIMYLLSYLIAIFLSTVSIYELNKVLDKYVDNKIAVSGRGLGSSGSSIGSINEADNKITWEDAVNDLPYKDSTYTADRDIIASHEELQVSGDTWLASRHMIPSEDYTYFAVRYLPANNSEATKSLYMARKTKIDDSLGEIPLGVRPIIYLDSDVVISGNNGNYTVSKK